MEDKDFVSFLVEETLKLQQSGESNLSSLELKLQDYSLEFIKGEFIPQSQVLHFDTPFGPLDVPINWSVFAMEDGQDYCLLNKKNDIDSFYTVLTSAWNKSFEQILITHADGFCYLVGLKAGEEIRLHDLLNPQEWLKAG